MVNRPRFPNACFCNSVSKIEWRHMSFFTQDGSKLSLKSTNYVHLRIIILPLAAKYRHTETNQNTFERIWDDMIVHRFQSNLFVAFLLLYGKRKAFHGHCFG